jgi:hypothetical protein
MFFYGRFCPKAIIYVSHIKALFLFFLLSSSILNALAQAEEFAIAHQCIVQVASHASVDEVLIPIKDVYLKEVLSRNMKIYLIEKKTGDFTPEEIRLFSNQPYIIAAQYNHRISARGFIPNDPFFSQQWNMLNTGQLNGKPGTDIRATEAWTINNSPVTKTGDTLVVAVVDEYFALQHEDLNFFVNRNEIPNNGIDDDGNGYIDDYRGWNAYNNTGDVSGGGGNNHSTGISGIIGAYTNNAIGVAGVVSGVKILPVSASSTQESEVIKGYDYVIEMRKLWNQTAGVKGAFVVAVNSSFGVDNGKPQNFPVWCAMYDTMGKLGILNAAATTNQGIDVDVKGDIPTTCPSKWLITVNGHTSADQRYGGYGVKNIDLAAPATGVVSTLVGNNYGSQSGTSFACPHVAGAVAAIFAEACPQFINHYLMFPDSFALYVKDWILHSVTKTIALNNKTTSDGRLHLFHSVLYARNFDCNQCGSKLQIQAADVRCKNENNGHAQVSLKNNYPFSIQWSDGDTSRNRTNLKPGLYQLTVSDINNCPLEAAILIREPDTLMITNITVVPPSVGNGNIIVNASGGGDSLEYSLDGVSWQPSNIFVINSLGQYTVHVKNETGCVVAENVWVNSSEALPPLHFLSIYPNPARDVIQIQLSSAEAFTQELNVIDITGRCVATRHHTFTFGLNQCILSVENLVNGIYFLKLNKLPASYKFFVVR